MEENRATADSADGADGTNKKNEEKNKNELPGSVEKALAALGPERSDILSSSESSTGPFC